MRADPPESLPELWPKEAGQKQDCDRPREDQRLVGFVRPVCGAGQVKEQNRGGEPGPTSSRVQEVLRWLETLVRTCQHPERPVTEALGIVLLVLGIVIARIPIAVTGLFLHVHQGQSDASDVAA